MGSVVATSQPCARQETPVSQVSRGQLQLGKFGERADDAPLVGAEIDRYGDRWLDIGDGSHAVGVVGYPLIEFKDLGLDRHPVLVERAAGQFAGAHGVITCSV